MLTNLITIDVEDWFQVFYGESKINHESWPQQKFLLPQMIEECLSLLDEAGVKATFFTVAWLADTHPEVVRKISDHGHEIGSHSYWHREVHRLSLSEFREDLIRSKRTLENTIGKAVNGFRAPGYSIKKDQIEYIKIIQEEGFLYDSSLLGKEKAPYRILPGLIEIPPNALGFGKTLIPSNGGFFFRMLPFIFFKAYVKYLILNNTRLNFYTHTWELFTDYPKIEMTPLRSFIQYTNLDGVHPKFKKLIATYPFSSIEKSGILNLTD